MKQNAIHCARVVEVYMKFQIDSLNCRQLSVWNRGLQRKDLRRPNEQLRESEHIISDCCVANLKCSTVFTGLEEMGFREPIYCELRLVFACDVCSFYDNWSRHVYGIEIILLRNTDYESFYLFIYQNIAICPKTFSNSIDIHR
jgi:hypothetical protein